MEIVVALLFGAAGIAAYALRSLEARDIRRTRRVLRKTRVVPISQLVDGQLACIVGRVEVDDDVIESMMERRLCVAFDTITKQLSDRDMTMNVHVTRRAVPFFVVDDTGRVRVDAPEVALCNKPIVQRDRYEERIIENGAMIRIVGSVSLDPAMQTSDTLFRHGGFTARLTGTTKWPLLADVERS